MIDYYELELIKTEDVAKDIKKFIFKPNEKFDFKSGNYVLMYNNKNPKTSGLSRPFTITSITGSDTIDFIIKKVGVFTTELFNLKLGDKIDIEAPHGNMFYEESQKDIVFIAGGTGITPFISMQDYVKKNNLKTNFKLFYSVKTENEIIQEDLLSEYKSKIVISASGKRIDKDFLEEHLTKEELENKHFFVCGPPPFEEAIENILKGIGAKNIHIEG